MEDQMEERLHDPVLPLIESPMQTDLSDQLEDLIDDHVPRDGPGMPTHAASLPTLVAGGTPCL